MHHAMKRRSPWRSPGSFRWLRCSKPRWLSKAGGGVAAGQELDRFLKTASIELVPITAEQADSARRAWRRFGKGNHPAGLNFGDCFVYALAQTSREPLLFKGEDFARTDIEAA